MNIHMQGELGFMPLPDLLQWLEQSRKTVIVSITDSTGTGAARSFYFQDGQVIFVSSGHPGERFGEFLTQTGQLEEKAVTQVLQESRKWGLCFTQHLIDKGVISEEVLADTLSRLAETILLIILSEGSGRFEVGSPLPMVVRNGPVQLGSGHMIMDAIRKLDEVRRNKEC